MPYHAPKCYSNWICFSKHDQKGYRSMSDVLKRSWDSFPKDVAKDYLKRFGHPCEDSKLLLYEVLKSVKSSHLNLLDLGCGNANLAEYLSQKRLTFSYTGIDFSNVLLDAAKSAYPRGNYAIDDLNLLKNVSPAFDVVCYSHVIEMLSSPESSLIAASKLAPLIVIRFFEPPAEGEDWVELQEMDVGHGAKVPYLRRRMSLAYYELILSRIGCKSVDVYQSVSKDQVHLLKF